MADPLSISASIAGLVSLADIVFLRLTKYIKSVKNADTEINELRNEVNLLGGAFNMLSRLARGHEMEDEPFNKDFRMYHIEGCSSILTEISQKTKKYDANPKSKVLKLMWPYTSSKTKELLANLSRHKENINLALTANSMEVMLRCLAKEEDREKTTAEIRADVQRTREIVVRIQEDSKREMILRFFLSYNPQPNYEMSVKLRHPMTGMWLERLLSFQTWLLSPGSRLWLSGIPGAGKTVLAGSIIGQALGRSSDTVATSFFFCDYKNEITQTPSSVLGALAHQLALQNEHAYSILEDYYSELHPEKGLARPSDKADLIKIIVLMAESFEQVYMVIDGLDECQDNTEEVVDALCEIARSSGEISMALLSRNEDIIRVRLQNPEADFANEEIAAHKEDITEYVTSEVQQRIDSKRLRIQDLSLKGEIVDGLVDGANGMFRWVACQLDHLGDCMSDQQCREALRSLPPDLPETYLRILKRIPEAQQVYVQLTLDFIAFANPKLSISQLREVLSVPSDGSLLQASGLVREDAITRHCGSLIRKSNDGEFFEFAHFSVQEFLRSHALQSSKSQMFSISESRCNRRLATRCVEYLQLQNFSRIPTPTEEGLSEINQISQIYPLYSYAASNWTYHAREHWDDASLLASAKQLFDPCKSACFTHWAVFLVLHLRGWVSKLQIEDQINLIAETVDESTHPLHFAATLSLPEITSALLEQIKDKSEKSLIEQAFEWAIDCLWGAVRLGHRRIWSHLKRWIATDTSETYFALETIQVFINFFDEMPKHLISFAIQCWAESFDFSVAQLLVTEGISLAQGDVNLVAETMQHLIDQAYGYKDHQEMKSICLFCESLSRMIDKSALHFELCQLIWKFALALAAEPGHVKTYEIDSRISEDKLSLEYLAKTSCDALQAAALHEAVNDARIDTSSIKDPDTGNSLFHMLVLADHEDLIKAIGLQSWEAEVGEILNILLGDGCSLSSRNNKGHTPFSLALENGETGLAEILLNREEFQSGAWDSPVPILLLVAKSGSEAILDQLLDQGLEAYPGDYVAKSPLHCLTSKADLALVTHLEHLVPGSRELQIDGKMPWEAYLDHTDFDPPSSDVLRFLIQPFLQHSQSSETSAIWDSYTANLSQRAFWKRYQAADQMVTTLVQDGVLKQYEKNRSESGLFSFAKMFSVFSENSDEGYFPINDSTMCLLVETTEYWTSFQDSDCAVQVLKLSTNLDYNMTSFQLMRRGVKVHRRVEGVSALEHVYGLPAIDDNSISRVQQFLKHADSTSINQTNPTSGLGLIHISNDLDEQQCRGKILELTVESGASPDLRTASDLGFTGLLHHLHQRNFDSACILLDQGANPLLSSLRGWTAVHMAAAKDATPFLSRLLSPKESAWTIDWESGCRGEFCSEIFDNATPLHLAAAGSGEFLLLLLERVPAINVEATTGNGLTAIHSAAMAGSINCTDILVSRGANVNARSADGRLALHIAVEKGNLGLVERLLELGSEMTARSDGMTPQLLAYGYNHQSVIDRLKAHAAESPAAAPLWDNVPSSALAKAVSGAVRAGSLSACKVLLGQESSVDVDMSEDGTRGFTPLGFAIRHGMLEIAEWLLKEGANANCLHVDGRSAIQDMIADDYLNPILQDMLDRYFADGGSILSEANSLIYSAVDVGNTEGLSLLLEHLRTNEKEYMERAGSQGLAAVRIAVNSSQGDYTPLHRAIQCKNKDAIQLLLNSDADLGAMDSFNRTPLIYATQRLSNMDASTIVPLLVKAGSNPNRRDDEGMDPLMGACESRSHDLILYLMNLGVSIHTTDHIGSNCLHYLLHNTDEADTTSIVPAMFIKFTGMLVDPYQTNKLGWAALHYGIHRRSMTALLLNGDFQGLNLTQIPWSTTPRCPAFPEVACLTSGFRLYRRRMSFERFRKLLNTEPADVWSPLCRAAAIGNLEVMKNLLSMGSLIDFEGCPEGSALMTASKAGILDSVIFLTRHGASISFQGRKQYWSAVDASAGSMRVVHWLLVDRFTDQFKLNGASDESDVSTENFKVWSGITKAEMVILGPWQRRASESSRQYWSRLEKMKQDFNGKVVPPDRGAKTRRQSKLIPSEPVRIAAGGYNSTEENR